MILRPPSLASGAAARAAPRANAETAAARAPRAAPSPLCRRRRRRDTADRATPAARRGAMASGATAGGNAAAQQQQQQERPPPADVFALDFDGVLVDSEPEVSHSALQAAASFGDAWRAAIPPPDDDAGRAALLAALRRTRPVLVRGYEAVVMARLLGEALRASSSSGGASSSDDTDAVVARILRDWPAELDEAMRRFGETQGRAPLEAHFERCRASSMSGASGPESAAAWLALNRPYPTRGDALRAAVSEEAAGPIYFVSSKKASRVSRLLRHHFALGGVGEASPRLFASLLPPEREKRRALGEIMSRWPVASSGAPRTRMHFVDDRLDTLLAVLEDGGLAARWTLYLAAWGYCAPGEVREAERDGRVRVLRRPEELAELLRWGLVGGGVDDGCEAQPEEKAAAGWLSS